MEALSSDPGGFHAEFPLKSKLCLFCVQPIYRASDLLVCGDKDNDCNFNCQPDDLISQSTFLQCIGLLCESLKIDEKFAGVEQWAIFGVDNFVNFLCCEECAILVEKLVKLHQLILETQASLKSEVGILTNHIIQSSCTSSAEYSINTCVQFREEIINNYKVINENIRENANLPPETQPPTETPVTTTTTRTRSASRLSRRPMPLSKKRTLSRCHQPQTPSQPIIPESFVKLERLENEVPPSPATSFTNDHFTEDILNEDNSDTDYQPTNTPTRTRGKGHRKRGRPPKSKPSKKKPRGRPPKTCKSASKVNITVYSDDDNHNQDSIAPKDNPEDHEDDPIPKRGPGRPLKVGSRLYRSLHGQEGSTHKPIYLLPPSPTSSHSSTTSPSQLLMYFNVPFQKTSDSLLCLYPSCPFTCPLSPYSPSQQIPYSTMLFHIRHLHRFKHSTPTTTHTSPHLYYCHHCSTHLPSRLDFLHHRKSLHRPTTPMPPVLCQVCDLPLPSTSHLLKHLPTHKSPEELSTTSTLPRPRRKFDPLKSLSHPCDQCSKSFKCFTELRIHKVTHIPLQIRRQHQCDQCGEKFINHNTLKGHLDRVHLKTMSKDLSCRYCARQFFNRERSKYEAHLRTHTGEKPYQCAECGKGFHQKWNLTMHERLHGEDTVTCEFCSGAFKTQKYLRRHQRKHHKEFVEERDPEETKKYKHLEHTENFIGPKLMFPCEPCQHVYRFKSILVSHLKRMHQMNFERKEDFPNMWTFEDEGLVVNGADERPRPPGGWRGRGKKNKVKIEEEDEEQVEFLYQS